MNFSIHAKAHKETSRSNFEIIVEEAFIGELVKRVAPYIYKDHKDSLY